MDRSSMHISEELQWSLSLVSGFFYSPPLSQRRASQQNKQQWHIHHFSGHTNMQRKSEFKLPIGLEQNLTLGYCILKKRITPVIIQFDNPVLQYGADPRVITTSTRCSAYPH